MTAAAIRAALASKPLARFSACCPAPLRELAKRVDAFALGRYVVWAVSAVTLGAKYRVSYGAILAAVAVVVEWLLFPAKRVREPAMAYAWLPAEGEPQLPSSAARGPANVAPAGPAPSALPPGVAPTAAPASVVSAPSAQAEQLLEAQDEASSLVQRFFDALDKGDEQNLTSIVKTKGLLEALTSEYAEFRYQTIFKWLTNLKVPDSKKRIVVDALFSERLDGFRDFLGLEKDRWSKSLDTHACVFCDPENHKSAVFELIVRIPKDEMAKQVGLLYVVDFGLRYGLTCAIARRDEGALRRIIDTQKMTKKSIKDCLDSAEKSYTGGLPILKVLAFLLATYPNDPPPAQPPAKS